MWNDMSDAAPNTLTRLAGDRGYVDVVLFDGKQEHDVMVHGLVAGHDDDSPCKAIISIQRDMYARLVEANNDEALIVVVEKLMHPYICSDHDIPEGQFALRWDEDRDSYQLVREK